MDKLLETFKIKIDPMSARPVYEQVKQGIQMAILSGYLNKDDKLMPIRELAKKLKINPNTIVKVYYQLDIEGFIYSKPGLGYFVKETRKESDEGKPEMFAKVTEEYISLSSKLGYSIEEMILALKNRGGSLVSTSGSETAPDEES